MIPNICIKGSEEHVAIIIKFFKKLGAHNLFHCDCPYYFYFFNDKERQVDFSQFQPQDKKLISLEEVIDILDNRAILQEDGMVVYNEQKEFPRMMWVWDYKVESAIKDTVHGYISTLESAWITKTLRWKNASDADPRIQELTIEEAEEKFNIKIKRQ